MWLLPILLAVDSVWARALAQHDNDRTLGAPKAPGSTPTEAQYAYPRPCIGQCGNTHDLSLARRDDGTYFRFSTGGHVQIYTAPNIWGPWEFACEMLSVNATTKAAANQGGDLWGPDVHLVDDLYYVYYSVSTFATQTSQIGFATSPSMDCGTWTDHGPTGIASYGDEKYNAIDANLFDDCGTWRMTFGSFWKGQYQVEMSNPPRRKVGESVQVIFDPAGEHATEGAFMIYAYGYYYMFFSWGKCCGYDKDRPAPGQEYKIKVCRSEYPNAGFEDANGVDCRDGGGTIVYESHGEIYGAGGQSVYEDPVEGWVIAYHYVNTRIGYADADKLFGWNYLDFSSGWPALV